MHFLKTTLFMIMSILNILFSIFIVEGIIWFVIPSIQKTGFGSAIASVLSNEVIFYILIACAVLFITFSILCKFCFKSCSAKFKNFFIHLTSWIMAITAILTAILGFIYSNIEISTFDLSTLRKTGILVCFGLLFLSHIVSGKIAKIVNRKIQSYNTAKEMNIPGRSSIVWTNLLRLVEVLFPEIIILTLISFCVSWNVAAYFLIILVASIIPMMGNIFSDFNTRSEILRDKEKQNNKFIEDVAKKVKEV